MNTTNNNSNKILFTEIQKQFISSAIGSASASVILSPLVITKVRLQHLVNSASQIPKVSILSVVKNIYKSEGILGFWNGGTTSLIQALPSSTIYLTVYERLKQEFNNNISSSSSFRTYIPLFSAAIARTISVSCISPLELIRTIQASGIEKSIHGIVKDIIQQTGLKGLYKGWSSTLLRDVPYSSLYWFSFEVFILLLLFIYINYFIEYHNK